jgi:hypothetical protein
LTVVKKISAAKGAYFDTYDEFNDKVYVTDVTTNSVYVLS